MERRSACSGEGGVKEWDHVGGRGPPHQSGWGNLQDVVKDVLPPRLQEVRVEVLLATGCCYDNHPLSSDL